MITAKAAILKKEVKRGSQKGRKWTNQCNIDRENYTYGKLLNKLRIIEPNHFCNFLRMDGELFNELLTLVTPEIG